MKDCWRSLYKRMWIYQKLYNAKKIKNSKHECQTQRNVDNDRYIVLDPEKSVKRGRRKRIRGHFEKRKQHTTKKIVWFHNTKQTHYIMYTWRLIYEYLITFCIANLHHFLLSTFVVKYNPNLYFLKSNLHYS